MCSLTPMRTASAPSAGKGFCYCSHPGMLDIARLTRCLKVVSVSRMRRRVSEQRSCLDGPGSWIELCVCENPLVVLFLLNMEHQLTPQYIRHHVCRAAGPPESEHRHCQPWSTSRFGTCHTARALLYACSIRTQAYSSSQSASFARDCQPDLGHIDLIMKRSGSANPDVPIPILPRTANAARPGSKRCEMCGIGHDATFGAGRFCSSKCARTVGGLAHRRKRALERAAQRPPPPLSSTPATAGSSSGLPKPTAGGKGKGGRRMSTFAKPTGKAGSTTRIAIPKLLNPEKK